MQALFTFLLIPLIFLNLFGGLVSGVWLALLGDWWAITAGIAGMFLSSFLLSFALMPAILFAAPAVLLVERNKFLLASPFILLSTFYTVSLITMWCLFVFWYFMSRAAHDDFLPLLLWSYGAALGPWMYLAQRNSMAGADGIGEGISIFFAQAAYITMIFVVIFSSATLLKLFVIFSAIMTLGLVVQLALAFLLLLEQRRMNETY